MSDEVTDDVGILPLVKSGPIFHVFRDVVTSLVPTNADLFTLVKATAKDFSRQKRNANVSQGW